MRQDCYRGSDWLHCSLGTQTRMRIALCHGVLTWAWRKTVQQAYQYKKQGLRMQSGEKACTEWIRGSLLG